MTTIPNSAEVTRRLFPPLMPRRPDADPTPQPYHPRTIGIVDPPLATTEIPLLAQLVAVAAENEPARRHRGRHRRPAVVLPGVDRAYPVLLSAGVFLTGVASGGAAAVFLIGAGW